MRHRLGRLGYPVALTAFACLILALACKKNEAGSGRTRTPSRSTKAAAGAAAKGEWLQWRGPNRDGITSDADWNDKWSSRGPKKLWEAKVGVGFSAVSIQDGRLYTLGNRGGQDTVYCLDINNGKEIWKQSYRCPLGSHGGPRVTPTIDGRYVYTLSYQGQVYCFNANDGKILWSRDLGKEGFKPPTWGYAGSPLIEGRILIVNVGLVGVALDKDTGKIIWKTKPGKSGYASAVLFIYEGKKYLAMFSGRALMIVDPENGRIICDYPWRTSYDVNAADPIVSGDKIFISSGYNDGACGVLQFNGHALKLVWKNTRLKNHFATSVLYKGYLYGFNGNVGRGQFKCLDFATGDEKWSWGRDTGFCMIADGKIVALTSSGTLFDGVASPEGFSPISKARVLDGKTWNMPTLCGGRIYVRNHDGDLLCLDVSK